MPTHFRNYTKQPGITEDYYKVRAFFIKLGYAEFTYTRWDWMATHGYLDKSAVGRIGIFEDESEIVGLTTFDCRLGEAFCLALPQYAYLKKDLLLYAKDHLSKDGKFGVVIVDTDTEFQDIAARLDFTATEQKENDAIFYLDKTPVLFNLPEGFHITTMKDTYDLFQYRRVLWKGFNHELNGEGEFQFPKETERETEEEMNRPNVDLSLNLNSHRRYNYDGGLMPMRM